MLGTILEPAGLGEVAFDGNLPPELAGADEELRAARGTGGLPSRFFYQRCGGRRGEEEEPNDGSSLGLHRWQSTKFPAG